MANDSLTDLRLQLLARGYKIIPNIGKVPAVAGWNTLDYLDRELQPIGPKGRLADRIARWPRRWPQALTTGLRIEGGLVVLDIDVDDHAVVDALLLRLSQVAPEVHARAPTRYGGGQFKMALFARLSDGEAPFVRLASRKYGEHQIEAFGGAMLPGNRCSRQFGIYGPHSTTAAGTVIDYVWAESALDGVPALHEVDASGLPVITRAQVLGLLTVFELIAAEAGWQPNAAFDTEAGEIVYDITPETRFDTNRGIVGVDYSELCIAYEIYGEGLRCSSNFMPGRGVSGRVDRCLVGDQNRHGAVGVWVPGDEALHLPAELARPQLDPDAFAEQLRAAAAEAGAEIPITEPNWRERYKKSLRPMASLHNARLAIEALKIHCSRDLFHLRQFMGRGDAIAPSEPLLPFFGQVTDDTIGSLRMWLSNTFGFDPTEKHVRDAVNIMCGENAFNPVVDMLAEAEANWDGMGRLEHMAVDHFNCADTELNREIVRKTMIAAVARARNPGCKFDTILVMESKEGWNKSSAWRVLAGEGNFSDASVIGHAGREVQEQLADIWIHENAELAGMRKADIEVVKAFASRQEDRARPAYGHYLVTQPRHSIEVGTTNADVYLQSQNGNRRFWPVEVLAPIDLGKLRAARLQLWGEAAHDQSQGEELTLDEALWPAAGAEQERRRVQHPWEATLAGLTGVSASGPVAGVGYIGNGIVHVVGDEWRVATAVIFEHVLRIPNGQLDMRHSKTLADVMRTLGWERAVFQLDGKATKGYKRTDITGPYR